jgi:hypothetical protein
VPRAEDGDDLEHLTAPDEADGLAVLVEGDADAIRSLRRTMG